MTKFYDKTAVLWTLTRALLILLLIASMVLTFYEVGFYLQSAFTFLLLGIYTFLLGITLFKGKTSPSGFPFLRTTGIFTLIYAVIAILSIVKINIYFDGAQLAGMVLFSIWLLLFGLGDILKSRKLARERNPG